MGRGSKRLEDNLNGFKDNLSGLKDEEGKGFEQPEERQPQG